MRTLSIIDLVEAERVIEAATRAAAAEGLAVHVAVCDAVGQLVAYRRMDGANPVSGEIAQAKAFAAAGTRAATTALAPKTIPGEPGWGLQHMAGGRLTTLGGGVPIRVDGTVIGAVGVSGASVAQDIALAEAAAAG